MPDQPDIDRVSASTIQGAPLWTVDVPPERPTRIELPAARPGWPDDFELIFWAGDRIIDRASQHLYPDQGMAITIGDQPTAVERARRAVAQLGHGIDPTAPEALGTLRRFVCQRCDFHVVVVNDDGQAWGSALEELCPVPLPHVHVAVDTSGAERAIAEAKAALTPVIHQMRDLAGVIGVLRWDRPEQSWVLDTAHDERISVLEGVDREHTHAAQAEASTLLTEPHTWDVTAAGPPEYLAVRAGAARQG